MRVMFYRNNSDERQVNKSISQLSSVDCRIKEGTSMLNPIIEIMGSSFSAWSSANYMYIDTFNRYYFIDDITASNGGVISVSGRVDVLQSNSNAIRNINCLVLRQQNRYNRYYQDSKLQIRSQKTFIYKKIGSLPSVKTNILTVDGGIE